MLTFVYLPFCVRKKKPNLNKRYSYFQNLKLFIISGPKIVRLYSRYRLRVKTHIQRSGPQRVV
jgi:hypothetical protein